MNAGVDPRWSPSAEVGTLQAEGRAVMADAAADVLLTAIAKLQG
jgi:hypothetical protein